MKHKYLVDDSLLLPGETNRELAAKQHPKQVNGFSHWSRPGYEIAGNIALSILTFDSYCPQCQKIAEAKGGRP